MISPSELSLPPLPQSLSFGPVKLVFSTCVPGDASLGYVPYYHFRVWANSIDVGRINLRVANTDHVKYRAGHIGYEIAPAHRGHRYALFACYALAPFAGSISDELIITCNHDNVPSRKTIERLGAKFLDEIPVPEVDPMYANGARVKRRYLWRP